MRKDGESTRRRILDVALAIFGERGYRDTTNAAICEAAAANIAAINYHFRSKEQLYRAVCAYAINAMDDRYPPEGNAPPEARPEVRLRAHIEAVIGRSRVEAPLCHYHSLRMIETFHPSGLVDDLWNDWFGRHRDVSAKIIAELLGPGAEEDDILRCQMSLMSQCYIANSSAATGRFHTIEATHLQDVEAVIEHIYAFTRAGIQAIARKKEKRATPACS